MGRLSLLLLLLLPWEITAVAEEKALAPRPIVLVHVMTWFEARPAEGFWGTHWTMGKTDPGKGKLAAHNRPLIGPYDSSNPAVLNYQVALMKAAGIDGAIIDWYGPDGFDDYVMIHRNTCLLIEALKKAGLKFALCIEDQTGQRFMKQQGLTRKQATAKVAAAFCWADEHWLTDSAYVRISGRPVVLVFGPQHLTPEEWMDIRPSLRSHPLVFGLPHLSMPPGLDGSFAWVPVSSGATVSSAEWQAKLATSYAASTTKHPVLAAAFPGFHDYYEQAGLRKSFGRIERDEGRTLATSLDQALGSGAPIVQIVTWNDYGEGTVIEPTLDHGHRDLELIMKRLRPGTNPSALHDITKDFQLSRQK